MENKIYNDDVERIVNDPERKEAINAFHEKRYAKRQRKMLTTALAPKSGNPRLKACSPAAAARQL